ncbi:MAG TPA: class I SAM-dependent methyltransferase [Pseudonocardiaceae bacterium]|nr:class I SAM-dependent methyltransferase [Pseudonocardiaceae bacterium]
MRSPGVAPLLAELATGTIGDLPIGLRAWDGSTAGPTSGPKLVLRSRRALRRLLWDPDELGLARAYVSGDLDVDGDLTEGLRRFWAAVRDGRGLSKLNLLQAVPAAARLGVLGLRPKPPVEEARLTGRLHTTFRDRAAIAHHYDLGNDFYQALLDPSMAYSCAYYPSDDMDLADAQRAKLDLICDKLDLKHGMRVLDVGCGWGSFVVHAAKERGVDVTGITLSARQAEHVRQRIADDGVSAKVQLLDYRELSGEPFDAIVSVEMGEHVGEVNYPEYTAILFRMLKPGGSLLLQQMSRPGNAPGGGAFIESYIAPDMTMRPLGRTIDHLAHAGFEVRHVDAMREMYATTIRAWLATLERKPAELITPGTLRVWRLYLAGGALAFEENRMGVDQILARRNAG